MHDDTPTTFGHPDPVRYSATKSTYGRASHRPMFAADIIGFGRRDSTIHPHLREVLYRIVTKSFTTSGIHFNACHHEDRGDGILVIAPDSECVEKLLGSLITHMHGELRYHNRFSTAAAQLRLRIAINAGYIRVDDHGASGDPILHLFRLLDSSVFRAILDDQYTDLGLITSEYLYQEVICSSRSIDPGAFTAITISTKETTTPAWVWLPPLIPHPSMHTTAHADRGGDAIALHGPKPHRPITPPSTASGRWPVEPPRGTIRGASNFEGYP